MNRLLNKTLLYYTLFATIILLLSSPFFYLMMEKLYVDDVDEAIMLRKKEFLLKSQSNLKTTDISVWNRFNRDTRILPDTIPAQHKERIIQQLFYDEMKKALVLSVIFVFFTLICNAQNWDIDLLKEINLHRNRSLDPFFRIITDYAAPIAYSILIFLFLLPIIQKNKRLKIKSAIYNQRIYFGFSYRNVCKAYRKPSSSIYYLSFYRKGYFSNKPFFSIRSYF